MRLFNSKTLGWAWIGILGISACTNEAKAPARDSKILTILHDFSPPTLNPRFTTEATGQRIGMLLFSGLTKLDSDLKAVPAIATSWSTESQGLVWKFKIDPGAHDWEGHIITADEMRTCLEEYMSGKPTSPLKGSFPAWKTSRVEKNSTLVIELNQPDPYLARNLVLLKFFRVRGVETPCAQPANNQEVIGSGMYRGDPFEMNPESSFTLAPTSNTDPTAPKLRFIFLKDETSRTLKLMDGNIDIAQNTLSQTKLEWVLKKNPDFRVFERPGVNVSYLAYNLKNRYLADVRVRRAIAHAIDRDLIMREKLKDFVSPAGSFLSPLLPEAYQSELKYDPALSEKLLDQAGYPKNSSGIRFSLKYKTTPSRDGIEMAQIFKSMLAKVGVQLQLDIVDLGVYLSSTRKGYFDLYASRWIGVADGSIFFKTLHSKSNDNRVKYFNPEVDTWLDLSIHTPSEEVRKKNLILVQKAMGEDLPYFPLWFWSNALILRKDLVGLEPNDLSLSGGYQPLSKLRRKAP